MNACPTVLIEDTPSSDDAFGPEGPHQRVAGAIAEMIQSESGGKVVGLEGSWGSGKSTVVNLIRRHFEDDPRVAVQVFDAWAHEGDPLRRSYLERLITELQKRGWIHDKERWDDVIKQISQKKRDTHSQTRTRPTRLGQFFALSAFLVPLGTALAADALRDGVIFGWGWPPSWQFIFGAACSLAPLLVASGYLAYVFFKRLPADWSLIQQNETETYSTTTELANPTSIEFEKHFGDLTREALGDAKKERRLVLVVDNLDRVDADDALAIWSTLQTFLQDRRLRSESWFNRLWVLVPFDPRGLRKLWSGSVPTQQDNETPSAGDVVAESFFDKSFQIRFYVAPPVLSDWRTYLDNRLKQALPNHPEKDRHLVYRVYEHCTRQRTAPPTPRELIIFVNQIGAIHRQWLHEFPLDRVAYFVLEHRKNENLIEGLRKGTVPRRDAARPFSDENLVDSLAGLVFNVRPAKGRELLLSGPIHNALLEEGDLKELAEKHPAGFWPVLEIVASMIAEMGSASVGKAAVKLYQSGVLDEQRKETTTVIQSIRAAAENMTSFDKWDQETAEGVAALCRLLRDETTARALFTACAKAMEAETKNPLDRATLIQALGTILEVADELNMQQSLPEVIRLQLDPAGWRQACVQLDTIIARSHWKRVAPTAEANAVIADIQGRISAGTFADEDLLTLSVSSASALAPDWRLLIPTLAQRIDSGQKAPPEEALRLLAALWALRQLEYTDAHQALGTLVGQGHVANHLHNCRKSRDVACKAMCVFTSLYFMPDGASPASVANSAAGHQVLTQLIGAPTEDLVEAIVSLMRKFSLFDWPLRVLDAKQPPDALIAQSLRLIALGDEAAKTYPPAEFAERWQRIAAALQEGESESEFVKLVCKLNYKQALSKALLARTFSPMDAKLYAIVAESSPQGLDFLEWCQQGLKGLSKETWLEDLTGPASCSHLALVLLTKTGNPQLSTEFSDALEEHARRLAAGEALPPAHIVEKWSALLSCLRDNIRITLRERLHNLAINRDGQFSAEFFHLYGKELVQAATWRQMQTVTHIFSPLVREKNVAGLLWLRETLEQDPEILDFVASHEEFKERLQRAIDEPRGQDEAGVHIAALANRLGLTPSSTPTTEEERTERAID